MIFNKIMNVNKIFNFLDKENDLCLESKILLIVMIFRNNKRTKKFE